MEETKPSEVDGHVSFFDRFANKASTFVSRAPFFGFCLLFVTLWVVEGLIRLPTEGWSIFLNDVYNLQINTFTTVVTFLMVAILQNSQTRFEAATNKKLNAIADALADYLEWEAEMSHVDGLREDAKELRAAVGLEHREST